nr:odorant binding protein 11 [Pachyrhinus yasumatsui]
MKYLIFVSALFVVALGKPTDVHNIAEVHKACQSDPKLNVPEEVFDKLKKHEKVDLPENYGIHMVCMGKGLHVLNEDGKINVEGVKTHVKHIFTEHEKIESITTECAVDKATPEDTIQDLFKCLGKNKVLGGHDHSHSHHHSSESNESNSDEHNEHHHGHHHHS